MPANLLWPLLALGPAVLATILGMRATRHRTPNTWDDYRDIATVMEWFAAPVLVVAAPLLMRGYGLTDLFAGWLSAGAVLLFYAMANTFSPDTGGRLSQRLKGILASSGRGLGIAGLLVFGPSEIGLTHVYPSARLFLSLLWASYLGGMLVGFLVQSDIRVRSLGQSELLSRIQEIAQQCGVRLEQVAIISKIPGCPRCVNAVAVQGTQVALTQDLISSLTKAEVDAVIEHEIGHIADERIWSLDHALHYGGYLLLLALAFGAERHVPAMQSPWAPMRYVMWLAMFLIPQLLERWYSRRHERKANENVGVDTDPLSAISGLYKIFALNHHSVSRPWWSRIMSTHPYADEEIANIARQHTLSSEQVHEVFRRANAELLTAATNRYDLPTSDDTIAGSGDPSTITEPVHRPGRWDGWPVAVLALLGGILVMAGAVITAERATEGFMWEVLIVGGIVGCGVTIVLPIELTNRRRIRRLIEQIQARLAGKYGSDAVSSDLLVDVMLPDWEDRDQPWQGALFGISDGELVIRGEVSKVIFPLHTEMSVFRWADEDSAGSDARMVAIGYQDSGNPRAIHVRILGRTSGKAPSNWKQLERHIKGMLTGAGVTLIARDQLLAEHHAKVKWSARIPIAAAVYLLILAVADLVTREISGPALGNQIATCFIATIIAGPALWAWVTGVYKPDDEGH